MWGNIAKTIRCGNQFDAVKHAFILLLLCMTGTQGAWAAFTYESEEWDFEAAAQTDGAEIKMSSTIYSAIGSPAAYGETMTYGGTTKDICRFAFRYVQNNSGWWLRSNNGTNGLFGQNANNRYHQFAICNLHAGDIVTITYASNSATPISYVSGAHVYKTGSTGQVTNIESGVDHTVAQDGDLIIQHNDYYTYIKKIKIQTLQTEATYKITSTVNSNGVKENKFDWVSEGRLKDTHISIPFLDVEFGSDLNGTFVHEVGGHLGSYIPDWNGAYHTWFGDAAPYQGTFYKFTPLADGKFQAGGYLSGGEVHIFHKISEGNYEIVGSASGTGYVTVGNWPTLKKGHTYYLCEHPNDGSRDYNNFQLYWFQFNNYFDIPELGKVLENGATGGELVTVKTNGQPGGTLDNWSVKRTSPNIKDKDENSNLQVTCTNGVVSISGIEYKDENKDKAGVIILDLNFSGGDATFVVTIPYSAAWNNGKGHKWNFYDTRDASNPGNGYLEIGRYKDTGSLLQIETDKREWKFAYLINSSSGVTHDPMYQNAYDMAGDNADMIWETEGLWFDTAPYKSCLHNEYDLTDTNHGNNGNSGADRFVGILPMADGTSSFTIPGLKVGDRVLLKMGNSEASGSGDAGANNFKITNARDAIGTVINSTDNYGHGGTQYVNGDLRGCYHFISTGGDMKFTFVSGHIAKIYSIEIYRGQKPGTTDMNTVKNGWTYPSTNGDTYTGTYTLFNRDNNDPMNSVSQIKYFGKGQVTRPVAIHTSGNITTDSEHLFSAYSGGNKTFFKSVSGQYGMFRMRVDDMERHQKYVADYALQNITVGYLQKKNYPYTWDFTDLKDYAESNIQAEQQKVSGYNTKIDDKINEIEFMNYAVADDVKAIEQWKHYDAEGDIPAGYGLHVRNSSFNGEVMWGGGQLYAGNSIFNESLGLSIAAPDVKEGFNGGFRICDDGGICMTGGNWRITVPSVPLAEGKGALYVRATPLNSSATAGIVDGSFDYTETATDNSGDKIYAVKGTGADVTLYFNDMIVKKIAVSEDWKKVNVKGWTTESRTRVIDPALTGYMTGKDMRTYIVTGVEYSKTKKQATLTRIDTDPSDKPKFKDGCLMPIASDGDNNACIILNCTSDGEDGLAGAEANILDGGFHLFVPDMHDFNITENTEGVKKYWASYRIESLMKSQVSPTNGKTIPAEEGGYTNYAFTCKYYDIDPVTGNKVDDDQALQNGIQAFYRIVGGASSTGNQGYLPIKIEEETNNEGGETNPSRAASPARVSSPERFTIVFNNLSDVCLKDGDVNGDGLFNKLDVNTMADRLAGRPTAKFFTGVADMNNDGKIDIVDMTLMIKNITSE